MNTFVTGRCYCGACRLEITGSAETSAYCHCSDCRRWTGAPVAAFAAFPETALRVTGPVRDGAAPDGVARQICGDCGSPLSATFAYLPGQIYIPLGILDQAQDLEPMMHCHSDAQLRWLALDDDLPRHSASGRAALGRT